MCFDFSYEEAIGFFRANSTYDYIKPRSTAYDNLKSFEYPTEIIPKTFHDHTTTPFKVSGLIQNKNDLNVPLDLNHYQLSDKGKSCIYFLEKGYAWDIARGHPSLIYTNGFYLYLSEDFHKAGYKGENMYDNLLREVKEHYSQHRQEVDECILLSNLIR